MGSAGLKRILRRESRGIHASSLMLKMEAGLRKQWEERQVARDSRPGVCHVSTLTGATFCARHAYKRSITGDWQAVKEAPHSMAKLMIFYDGDTVEKQLGEMLRLAKGVELLELKQEKHTDVISGTPDFGIKLMGDPWIVECKSMHSIPWRKTESPSARHLQQVIAYEMLYGIPRGILLIKGKDVSDWKAFEVHLAEQQEVAREMAERIVAVARALRVREEPGMCDRKKCEACKGGGSRK